ncbi:MAG: hypothetical protein IMHGJWDQ_000707 [Candidatus Fervidibacter sp.]
MTQSETKHPPVKVYLTVWFWLFVLSFTAYFIDLMHLSFWLSAVLFTCVALLKAGLIAAYFMHLRFEKLNLVYTILVPLILVVALAAGVLPDALSVLLHRHLF